jgi:serine/threonine-protein kinase
VTASDEEKAPDAPLAEGEILAGKYQVERILGKGGMGVVVAAMHLHLRQRVAIKFLLPNADADTVKRFGREARASFKLRSEHVARVLDVGELPTGAPYMVMEYLEGSDLSRVSRKRGQLPFEDAVDYVLQACEAIGEAHTLGIVHRDLKPANLFLTTASDGSAIVKVLDFGISKDKSEAAGEEEMALTRTTAVLGSPYYMAPEQMRSTRNADARSDIWSIGIILYQLITKSVPFKAPSFVELALMVVTEEPPMVSTRRTDVPPGLEAAIMRCIRKNPAERFASVSELAAAIAPYGRPDAMRSAEWIARTQGAPMPVIERPSSLYVSPPSVITGASGIGSAISNGPMPEGTPSIPPPSTMSPSGSASGSPSIPPAPTGVGSSSTKDAAHAATASTWVGGGSGAATQQARKTGTRVIAMGAVVGATLVLGVLAAVHGMSGGPEPKKPTTAATAEAMPTPVATTRVEVTPTVGASAPAPAPVAATASASATASSVAVTPPRVTPGAAAKAPTTTPTAAPLTPPPPVQPAAVAPTPPPVAAPPPAPAPTAAPAVKKNVLDIDIK